MAQTYVKPTYSHGGAAAQGWAAVGGTTLGGGRPVSIIGSFVNGFGLRPALMVVCKGTAGSALVKIEANGGQVNSTTSVPPSDEWQDVTNGGITMGAGETICKKLMLNMPYWRTNLVSISGDLSIVSYVPLIHLQNENGSIAWTSASYPTVDGSATVGA